MAEKTLLLIDDSLIITERLHEMLTGLEKIGSIECAGAHSMALRLLMGASFDIVVLDINLPGGSGIDLLRHIKATCPQTIVIMLTNQSGRYYRDICKRLGADYFADKSNEFEVLPLVIASLL